jgi:hypothetical protein
MERKAFRPVAFMEVLSSGGRGYITDWYQDLEVDAQAEFDQTLIVLAGMPRRLWTRPEFSPLEGGICEVRFFADGKQYRPLGCDGPGNNRFTILVGAYKKMFAWTPRDARETAKRRRQQVLSGSRRIRVYDQYSFKDVSENQG